jgi:hypothetical protein
MLPGNSHLNTVQHATVDEAVFSVSSAPLPILLTDQWTRSLTCDTYFLCGLRHATIGGCVFCAWSVPRVYKKILITVYSDSGKRQTRPLVRERERSTSKNLELPDSNKDLVLSPRWVLHSKTDWSTDRRSEHNFDFYFGINCTWIPKF